VDHAWRENERVQLGRGTASAGAATSITLPDARPVLSHRPCFTLLLQCLLGSGETARASEHASEGARQPDMTRRCQPVSL
jgi:hypothetical protein